MQVLCSCLKTADSVGPVFPGGYSVNISRAFLCSAAYLPFAFMELSILPEQRQGSILAAALRAWGEETGKSKVGQEDLPQIMELAGLRDMCDGSAFFGVVQLLGLEGDKTVSLDSLVLVFPHIETLHASRLRQDMKLNGSQRKLLKAVFKHFAAGGNRSLDADQLAAFLLYCGVQVSDEEVDLVLSILDADNSGTVEFQELVENLLAVLELLKVRNSETWLHKMLCSPTFISLFLCPLETGPASTSNPGVCGCSRG